MVLNRIAAWLVGALVLAPAEAATALHIDSTEKYAWSAAAGWISHRTDDGETLVFSDHLEGFAWAENLGWVKLGSFSGGGSHTYGNTSATDWGVNVAGDGTLSGYAWSDAAGWINFDPTDGGVSIDPATGELEGFAWGENIGWVKFRGTAQNDVNYGVKVEDYPIDGVCGAADGVATVVAPTGNLCDIGTPDGPSAAAGTWEWSCLGTSSGDDAACSAPGGETDGDTGAFFTFAVTDDGGNAGICTVESVIAQVPRDSGPRGVRDMPFGVTSFKLSNCTADPVTIVFTYSESVEGMRMYKDNGTRWSEIATATLVGNVVSYAVEDNGPLDLNPNEGEIDDPSGPGIPAGTGPAPVPVPALSAWGLLALAALLPLIATRGRRG